MSSGIDRHFTATSQDDAPREESSTPARIGHEAAPPVVALPLVLASTAGGATRSAASNVVVSAVDAARVYLPEHELDEAVRAALGRRVYEMPTNSRFTWYRRHGGELDALGIDVPMKNSRQGTAPRVDLQRLATTLLQACMSHPRPPRMHFDPKQSSSLFCHAYTGVEVGGSAPAGVLLCMRRREPGCVFTMRIGRAGGADDPTASPDWDSIRRGGQQPWSAFSVSRDTASTRDTQDLRDALQAHGVLHLWDLEVSSQGSSAGHDGPPALTTRLVKLARDEVRAHGFEVLKPVPGQADDVSWLPIRFMLRPLDIVVRFSQAQRLVTGVVICLPNEAPEAAAQRLSWRRR
jgi:hypothetical protein